MPEYPPGTPSWVELSTPDPDGAASFYGQLFGWEAVAPPGDTAGGYRMFMQGGEAVAGLMGHMHADRPTAWLTYFNVADADRAALEAQSAGGTVVVEPTDVTDMGRMAFLTDPDGAGFGVWQARAFEGADLRDEPVSMCWHELLTSDAEVGERFYTAVFDWEARSTQIEGAPPGYLVWRRDGQEIAGMVDVTGQPFAHVRPHWAVCLAVRSVDEIAERAQALGGSLTYEPMEMSIGRFVGIADPQGATVSVMQGAA